MHSKVSSDWLPSYIKATRQGVSLPPGVNPIAVDKYIIYSEWLDTFRTALVQWVSEFIAYWIGPPYLETARVLLYYRG